MNKLQQLKKELSKLEDRLSIHNLSENEICVFYMMNKKHELEDEIARLSNNNAKYSPFRKFEHYLIEVGIRSLEYTYTDAELYSNIEYFKKCFNDHLSSYKALLFLNDHLPVKPEITSEKVIIPPPPLPPPSRLLKEGKEPTKPQKY
jgi:hypothetical protein